MELYEDDVTASGRGADWESSDQLLEVIIPGLMASAMQNQRHAQAFWRGIFLIVDRLQRVDVSRSLLVLITCSPDALVAMTQR